MDIQNFTVTPIAAANVNVPRWKVTFIAVDSDTQDVILDMSAGINFPDVLQSLTANQRAKFIEEAIMMLIRARLG